MTTIPDSGTLMPQMCRDIRLFPTVTTNLLRLDLLFEAGSAYQPRLLCANAANKLCTIATQKADAAALSEFMDFRGIALEASNDVLQNSLTVYMLRRYAQEVMPVIADMIQAPAFAENDFNTWQKRQRQKILDYEQRSDVQARRLFYEALFGAEHPLGQHSTADDVDRLEIDDVRNYFALRHTTPSGIVLSGDVDEEVVLQLEEIGLKPSARLDPITELSPYPTFTCKHSRLHYPLPNSVQTSIRIGRIVPFAWDSLDYARLMLIISALGGYFGSRLMSNLREDKGYTYGVYARTQIYRGTSVFYISADVAGGTAEKAIDEVMSELRRLCHEPMPDDELQLVRTVMTGDFLRSVDGVFERATRHIDMIGSDVDERFTDNLREVLYSATPEELQRVASLCLEPDSMVVCTAGA